jgi:hypothetical protein
MDSRRVVTPKVGRRRHRLAQSNCSFTGNRSVRSLVYTNTFASTLLSVPVSPCCSTGRAVASLYSAWSYAGQYHRTPSLSRRLLDALSPSPPSQIRSDTTMPTRNHDRENDHPHPPPHPLITPLPLRPVATHCPSQYPLTPIPCPLNPSRSPSPESLLPRSPGKHCIDCTVSRR